jgi:pimeloyl-ACP methyl ester carboxylesterase
MSEFLREADPARVIPAPGKNNLWYVDRGTDDVIIFIHGILSDSRGCWMASTDAPEHDRYWPELVARDRRFDRFSIFLAGYFTQTDAGSFGIEDCAQQLFDALGEATRPNEMAPLARKTLLFVCHSTGGIVTRYMLESRVSAFSSKTIGLALIASPSYGARLANTMSSLMKLYGQKLGQQLEWANWGLEDLDARFRLLLAERRIPRLVGAEAYENRFIVHKKWLPRFASPLVEKQSAARYFAPARQLPDTDHFSAVKPTAVDHPSHLFLCAFLRTLENQETEWGVKTQPANREPNAEPLRHFLYISTDKVDSLYGQLNRSAGKNVFEKLDAIRAELAIRKQLGTPQEPKDYFAGHIDAVWSGCDFNWFAEDTDAPIVSFSSVLDDARTLILLGSKAFMVGAEVKERATIRYADPQLWAKIANGDEAVFASAKLPKAVSHIGYNNTMTPRRIEVLARHFFSDSRFVIGSPICIALPTEKQNWEINLRGAVRFLSSPEELCDPVQRIHLIRKAAGRWMKYEDLQSYHLHILLPLVKWRKDWAMGFWIWNELDGYKGPDVPPEYRRISFAETRPLNEQQITLDAGVLVEGHLRCPLAVIESEILRLDSREIESKEGYVFVGLPVLLQNPVREINGVWLPDLDALRRVKLEIAKRILSWTGDLICAAANEQFGTNGPTLVDPKPEF